MHSTVGALVLCVPLAPRGAMRAGARATRVTSHMVGLISPRRGHCTMRWRGGFRPWQTLEAAAHLDPLPAPLPLSQWHAGTGRGSRSKALCRRDRALRDVCGCRQAPIRRHCTSAVSAARALQLLGGVRSSAHFLGCIEGLAPDAALIGRVISVSWTFRMGSSRSAWPSGALPRALFAAHPMPRCFGPEVGRPVMQGRRRSCTLAQNVGI